MKINFKLRLKNKTTLFSLIACVIGAVYQIFGILGIAVPISEDNLVQFISLALTMLASVGVLVDPTTEGLSDSKNALSYEEPRKEVQ